ncbi:MAG: HsdM family class I SAM-dependent methyltransferase [Pyrinomonadaceae bacterium]
MPVVEQLLSLGWAEGQLVWQPEWRVPKNPSEAARRDEGNTFDGWPVDLAIFDSEESARDWQHLLAIFEFKAPDGTGGISQLETYMIREPRAKYGYWTNGSSSAALYKLPDGTFQTVDGEGLPHPTDNLSKPSRSPLTYERLKVPTERELRSVFNRLLEAVVAGDALSTRPDDQLNQICNLLLLKLDSDADGSEDPQANVRFQLSPTETQTARKIKYEFANFRRLRTDIFTEAQDERLFLSDHTIHQAVYELSGWRLFDMEADAVSTAFQVFRRANLKAGEGQYFTPRRIIESAVELMEIRRDDKIIDPACGTGGFLIEAFASIVEKAAGPNAAANARTWAHRQIFGVDRDSINVKLARAIMVILGDGSANIHVGDSLREHKWRDEYPHLAQPMKDDSYTVVITNPPFGKDLKFSPLDARRNNFDIAKSASSRPNNFAQLEIGLIFLERSYRLLVSGGRLGIVLPETYFFSPRYSWLADWLEDKLILRGVLNIPMEAFQGFCRAKTNFYVFEKI